MNQKVIGIVGSYRKGKVIDSAVSEVLGGAESCGADVSKIYLIDKKIEFCDNCRSCMQKPGQTRQPCVRDDDMEDILRQIDEADAVVLGSPMNIGTVTAVTKCFFERAGVYAYWPWGSAIPKLRIKKTSKKAITIASCAMPAIMAKIIAPGTMRLQRAFARSVGCKVVKSIWIGLAARKSGDGLSEKAALKAFNAGKRLFSE